MQELDAVGEEVMPRLLHAAAHIQVLKIYKKGHSALPAARLGLSLTPFDILDLGTEKSCCHLMMVATRTSPQS